MSQIDDVTLYLVQFGEQTLGVVGYIGQRKSLGGL